MLCLGNDFTATKKGFCWEKWLAATLAHKNDDGLYLSYCPLSLFRGSGRR